MIFLSFFLTIDIYIIQISKKILSNICENGDFLQPWFSTIQWRHWGSLKPLKLRRHRVFSQQDWNNKVPSWGSITYPPPAPAFFWVIWFSELLGSVGPMWSFHGGVAPVAEAHLWRLLWGLSGHARGVSVKCELSYACWTRMSRTWMHIQLP